MDFFSVFFTLLIFVLGATVVLIIIYYASREIFNRIIKGYLSDLNNKVNESYLKLEEKISALKPGETDSSKTKLNEINFKEVDALQDIYSQIMILRDYIDGLKVNLSNFKEDKSYDEYAFAKSSSTEDIFLQLSRSLYRNSIYINDNVLNEINRLINEVKEKVQSYKALDEKGRLKKNNGQWNNWKDGVIALDTGRFNLILGRIKALYLELTNRNNS